MCANGSDDCQKVLIHLGQIADSEITRECDSKGVDSKGEDTGDKS